MNIKRLHIIAIAVVAVTGLSLVQISFSGSKSDQPIREDSDRVEITFDFNRKVGMASNQFAVWITDEDGKMVRTIFATDFTAKNNGWKKRKESLPEWVKAADVEKMHQEELAAISGATPVARPIVLAWYLDDAEGKTVEPGLYTVNIEGSLRWANRVLYQGTLNLNDEEIILQPTPQYFGENSDDRDMIANLSVALIRPNAK
ncbi:MAG: DUF2271 domain-containing protein [Planctomycetes bacterium]|nr:DUF2271 domain-containing protein [Planctomycetota bacterium]MCD7897628.1 DUF2271 domain-containing protein [Planctomycetaceae bacterium]